jgi:hypothetical protein
MKKIYFLSIVILLSFSLFAQVPGNMPANGTIRQAPPSIGHIYGKLVDSAGKAVGDASVLILQTKVDTATKKKEGSIAERSNYPS